MPPQKGRQSYCALSSCISGCLSPFPAQCADLFPYRIAIVIRTAVIWSGSRESCGCFRRSRCNIVTVRAGAPWREVRGSSRIRTGDRRERNQMLPARGLKPHSLCCPRRMHAVPITSVMRPESTAAHCAGMQAKPPVHKRDKKSLEKRLPLSRQPLLLM